MATSCDLACSSLPQVLKSLIQEARHFRVTITCQGFCDTLLGRGDPLLSLQNEREVVLRTSSFTCSRTALIECNKAASDLDHALKQALRVPDAPIVIDFEVIEDE